MRRLALLAGSLAAAAWLWLGAAPAVAGDHPAEARPAVNRRTAVFYVGSHGWHTSIIVSRADIPRGAWPPGVAETDFAGCRYLELGWGDRKFYPAPKPTVLMALDAALLPGPSVLHVAGHDAPLTRAHAWSSLVPSPCTPQELANLCRRLGDSFERDAQGRAQSLGPGLYGRRSRFYRANGLYWCANTCNTWTARMMRAGGLPASLGPGGTLTAGAVNAQARRLVRARELCPGD